jgi:hypothetical protein
MLLGIIDISSMIMTCVFFKHSMITLGSGRIDKYLRVGIRNVVDIVVVVEFKRSDATPIIANNSTFLPNNSKCCVMCFIKKNVTIKCACDNMETLWVFNNGMQHLFLFII